MVDLPFSIYDTYDTPEGMPIRWLHRMLPHFQVEFKYRFLRINFHARGLAVRGRYPTEEWIRSSIRVMQLLESCGGRFHVRGVANIRDLEGPAVFAGNHMSTLETMVLPFLIAQVRDCTFVVKDTLVKSWSFGPVMRSRDPIVVSRHNSREDLLRVMDQGQRILGEGRSVVIFPQSTRRQEFRPEEFNSLAVKLAARASVPVVPFALKTDFWRNGVYVKDLGPLDASRPDVWFSFDKAMQVHGSGKEENRRIIDFIENNLSEWNQTESLG